MRNIVTMSQAEYEQYERQRLDRYTAGVVRDYDREMSRPDRTYNRFEEAKKLSVQSAKKKVDT